MIATKKTWLKDKTEGRQQGKKKMKHNEAKMLLKEKKRVKVWDQQDLKKTNGLLGIINKSRGPGLENFDSYQAGPFFIKVLLKS